MCGWVKSLLLLGKLFFFPAVSRGGHTTAEQRTMKFQQTKHRALDESVATEANERASLNCTKFRESFEASSSVFGHDSICRLAWLRVYLCIHKALGLCNLQKGFLFLLIFSLTRLGKLWELFSLLCSGLDLGWKLWNKEEREAFVWLFSFPSWFLCSRQASSFLFESFKKHVVVKAKLLFPRIAFPTLRLGFHVRCITFKARILFSSTENALRPCLWLLLASLERRSRFMSCDIRAWLRRFLSPALLLMPAASSSRVDFMEVNHVEVFDENSLAEP